MPIVIDPKKLPPELTTKYSLTNNALKLTSIKNAELDKYKNEPKDEVNVIVGDDKVLETFLPQVKLCRWTNETNFSIRLVDNQIGQETLTTSADKIKWSKGNIDIEFYDFIEGEGGYKMVWYLKKKPKTNKVEFTIQSKGLNFYYQPPLTQEYQNGYSEQFQKEIVVTETQVKDLEGNVLVERPENVVGSYAVYHSTKGGMNDGNGKDYKTGKAFHIFRPHIIDANGAETWGILKIENGIYSVEIPQEFLDKAVYPIKSNDVIGFEGTATAVSASIENLVIGNRFPASSSGTANSMSICLSCTTSAKKFKIGIYETDGNPLLDYTAEQSKAVEDKTWHYDIALTNNITITNGQAYLLVGFGSSAGGKLLMYYDSYVGYESDYVQQSATYGTFPDSVTILGTPDAKLSIYATYTPSAAFIPKVMIF